MVVGCPNTAKIIRPPKRLESVSVAWIPLICPFLSTRTRSLTIPQRGASTVYSRPSGRSSSVNSSCSPALSCTSPSPTLWTRFTTPRSSVPSGSTLAPSAHNGVATAAAISIPGFALYVEMGVNRRASIGVPCGDTAAARLTERHTQANSATPRGGRRAGGLGWLMLIGPGRDLVQTFDSSERTVLVRLNGSGQDRPNSRFEPESPFWLLVSG